MLVFKAYFHNPDNLQKNPDDSCETPHNCLPPAKKPMKSRTNIWEFVFNTKYMHHNKAKRLRIFLKRIFPHFFANFFAISLIFLQIKLKEICYLLPICSCHDDFLLKFYSAVRNLLTYYSLLCLITFYCYFIRAGLFLNKKLLFFYVFLCFAVIFSSYLAYDGDSSRTPDFEVFAAAFMISPVFHLCALWRLQWKLRDFLRKSLPGASILLIMFAQYLLNTRVLHLFKSFLVSFAGKQGLSCFKLVLSLYSAAYLLVFKHALIKFSVLVKLEKYPNENPIIFVSRVCLCYAITIQIASLVDFDVFSWGAWVVLLQYCVFLVQFFSRFSVLWRIIEALLKKLGIRLKSQRKSCTELEIEKIFTGTMVDFIYIFVSRVLTLFVGKHWINFHLPEFYKNCELEIAENRRFSESFVVFIVVTTVFIEVSTFLVMGKLRKKPFVMKSEKGNLWKRSYKIFMIHCIFELILQDFLSLVYS